MKTSIVWVVLAGFVAGATAAQWPELSIAAPGGGPRVGLVREGVTPVAGTRYRLLLESSADLREWTLERELEGIAAGADWPVPDPGAGRRFFRLRTLTVGAEVTPDGAEVFGYRRVFEEELRRAGWMTPEDFAAALPPTAYRGSLDFDPRQALYWDAFNADPAAVNAGLPPDSPDRRLHDFRLNGAELGVFLANGFVVSERLGSPTFADAFYRIFADDLPVYVSADAILHAWHFSFQRLLEESEETQMAPILSSVLSGMRMKLAQLPSAVRQGVLADSVADADYYLAVAQSLLAGEPAATVWGGDAAVAQTLSAIAAQQYVPLFPMFGGLRAVDFSQFKIRGHYERSVGLGRYFQAFMWTARTELRILGTPGLADPHSVRELGTAIVLARLLEQSGQEAQWERLDDLIRFFVGRPDSMTLPQLQGLLDAAGMGSLSTITSLEQLERLQEQLFAGTLGEQLYAGDVLASPFGPGQAQLPRVFLFTGQRFVPDGWALAQVTFDRVLWFEDLPGLTWYTKVLRRYPSALDVAYSVLGNGPMGDLIAERMMDGIGGMPFRDGLPYAHNLTAVAATFDRLEPAAWEDSLYTRWLAALRALSIPMTDARFPQAMQTRPWARRVLNGQLASYTELKHDTVLYAKQPYASIIICEYPAGFVEPAPEFWRRMREMAEAAAAGLERLPTAGTIQVTPVTDPWEPPWGPIEVDLAVRHQARLAFCRGFADRMGTLENLAAKELRQEPFTQGDIQFLRGLMNRQDHGYFGATYDGWYPELYYADYGQQTGNTSENGSNQADPLVTDIFTAPPDLVDPQGGVLHEATGNVDLLLITVDNGLDRMVYAGPVLSHYEFVVPGPALSRMTDSQWQGSVWPARPGWTDSYLVPK
ncbi:MAG TPA: DUF3160 domain-containing protein [Verrucomicrobiota bacterium]|nr:DUF3160 domain-containing protein [Verrucomicrobiota bacterium]HNU53227.1 DUF3160 domain-containing protein [Verrucomicrobiota bacterium]